MAKEMMNQRGSGSSVLKSSSCSVAVMKLIVDIENEAIRPQSKPKPAPKDHMKENFKRLKEIYEKSKYKKELNKPVKVPKQSAQYSQIQSKVAARLKIPDVTNKIRDFNSSNEMPSSIALPKVKMLQDGECLDNEVDAAEITDPPSTLQAYGDVCNPDLFHESQNTLWKYSTSSSVDKCKENADIPHPLGHIPTYLLERKKLWKEEEKMRLQQQIDSSIPPGHTLLSDDERQETLLLLRKNQDELLQRLASLPVRNDTMRLRNFKEELEKQLAKVDEGIKIFSRPKVLVKNDA